MKTKNYNQENSRKASLFCKCGNLIKKYWKPLQYSEHYSNENLFFFCILFVLNFCTRPIQTEKMQSVTKSVNLSPPCVDLSRHHLKIKPDRQINKKNDVNATQSLKQWLMRDSFKKRSTSCHHGADLYCVVQGGRHFSTDVSLTPDIYMARCGVDSVGKERQPENTRKKQRNC